MKVVIALLLLAAIVCQARDFSYGSAQKTAAETLPKGETFKVFLVSNPTTGFRWEVDTTLTKITLASQDHTGLLTAGDPNVAGAPGQQVFSFVAKELGTETLHFVYKRPWLDAAANTFDLVVTVVS